MIGELGVIHYLSISSSSTVFISKKKLVPAMRSFKGARIIHIEYLEPSIFSTLLYIFCEVKICNHPILPTQFLSAYFRTSVTVKQISCRSSCIFRAALIILIWEQPFEAATFSQNLFFRIPRCLWRSYFFLITTPCQQILFLSSYFLNINTFSAQLLFRRNFFSKISNSSEHILFRSRYFFQTSF